MAENLNSNPNSGNTVLCAVLVRACMEDDFETLLKHFPEGIEHRASRYSTAEDFALVGYYEDDARYNYPARNKMKNKVLQFVVQELSKAENGA